MEDRRHWNYLFSSIQSDDYVRKNFAFKSISEKECVLWNSKNSLFFVIKRTSENNYMVGCVCYFRVNFDSFRKASLVVKHIKDMSYCVDVLQAYKSTGIEFDLTNFTWNLLGFNELVKNEPLQFKHKQEPKKERTEFQKKIEREFYYRSNFCGR